MSTLTNDLRFAWQQASRRPGFSLLVVGVLALGIGATTAIFSLTDAALFRPLPIQEPEQVVRIFRVDEHGQPDNNLSYPHITDLRAHATSFSQIAAYMGWGVFSMAADGQDPQRVTGGVVNGEYFNLLGVPALLGRTLLPSDDEGRGANPVVVLSERAWRSQFGAVAGIIGMEVTINTHPFTVVGVMPARFGGADAQPSVGAWIPMSMMEAAGGGLSWPMTESRDASWLDGVARLAPGVTREQAQAEVDAIAAGVVEAEGLEPERMRLGLIPATVAATDPYGFEGARRNAWLLLGVTTALLLLAMTNTASLLLVRTEERVRELALRLGIGASRGRVLRMLLAESLAFATIGAVLGVALAFSSLSVSLEPLAGMLAGAPSDPGLLLSWRVVGVAVGLALLTAVASSVSPWLRVMQLDINTSLKQGGSRVGRTGARLRSAMVIAQVVLSVGLLTVALLLVRSFWNTAVIDPGFDPDNTLTVGLDFGRQGYDREQSLRAQQTILERLNAHPQVEAAAFARVIPVQLGGMFTTFGIPGREQASERMGTNLNLVSAGYMDAMRIPLLRGRPIGVTDTADAPPAIVINQQFAERWFPGEDALGQQIEMRDGLFTIVGIAADTKVRSLREDAAPMAFVPIAQRPDGGSSTLVVRGTLPDPYALLPAVREAVRAVDPSAPLFRVRTLSEHVGNSYREATVMAWLLGAFAALAATLASAGLYGLLSWQVRTRTREIGIRMSIGATARAVRNQFLKRGALLAAVGVPLGMLGAAWVARGVDELLFGITATDPVTLVAVAFGGMLIALAAAWLPARRSARISPMQALREE